MIIYTTDKIANYIKKTINYFFDFITTFGTLSLILVTMISPNLFTFILALILYVWGDKRGNSFITFLGVILLPITFLCYMHS
jgi:hypothetical protein